MKFVYHKRSTFSVTTNKKLLITKVKYTFFRCTHILQPLLICEWVFSIHSIHLNLTLTKRDNVLFYDGFKKWSLNGTNSITKKKILFYICKQLNGHDQAIFHFNVNLFWNQNKVIILLYNPTTFWFMRVIYIYIYIYIYIQLMN